MRRAARIDGNQREIVASLRAAGASVFSLSPMGGGCPDLLVGYHGVTHLFEVKDPDGENELSPVQRSWIYKWNGRPVTVVRNSLEALTAIGAVEVNLNNK